MTLASGLKGLNGLLIQVAQIGQTYQSQQGHQILYYLRLFGLPSIISLKNLRKPLELSTISDSLKQFKQKKISTRLNPFKLIKILAGFLNILSLRSKSLTSLLGSRPQNQIQILNILTISLPLPKNSISIDLLAMGKRLKIQKIQRKKILLYLLLLLLPRRQKGIPAQILLQKRLETGKYLGLALGY